MQGIHVQFPGLLDGHLGVVCLLLVDITEVVIIHRCFWVDEVAEFNRIFCRSWFYHLKTTRSIKFEHYDKSKFVLQVCLGKTLLLQKENSLTVLQMKSQIDRWVMLQRTLWELLLYLLAIYFSISFRVLVNRSTFHSRTVVPHDAIPGSSC